MLIFGVMCLGLAVVFKNEIVKLINTPAGGVAPIAALDPTKLNDVYKKLKIAPLSDNLASLPEISVALKDLIESLCDKTAIYRLSNALLNNSERRTSANALLGFADACPNSEGEQFGAASVLFNMGDYAAVVPVLDKLLSARPDVDSYYYLRGRSLAALGRYEEAIQDLSTTISLQDDLKLVNSMPFLSWAEAYSAASKHCQAMSAIQTYVYSETSTRDTAQTRKLIADYAAKGKCQIGYAEGTATIPKSRNDVTIVKADVNGVSGTFAFDTGASLLAIDEAFARKAGVTTSGASTMRVHTANGTVFAQSATVAEMALGKARASNVSAAILANPLGPGIDGLIGMSFLARFDIEMDERFIRIKPRQTPASSPQ
jgi:aspartyl protease family protein